MSNTMGIITLLSIVFWIVAIARPSTFKIPSRKLGVLFGFLPICVLGVLAEPQTPDKQLENTQVAKMNVISVSDYPYTMNGMQAVSLSVGTSEADFYDFTIHRANVTSGFSTSDPSLLSASKTNSNGYYVVSSKHNTTFAKIDIVSINPETKQAIINFSAKLVTPSPENYIELPKTQLTISGKLFDNLMKT